MAPAAKPSKSAGRKSPPPHPPDSAARRPAVLERLPAFARLVVASPSRPGGTPDLAAIEIRSPFDHSLIGTLPRSTPEDVVLAQARLRLAQEEWAMRPFAERAKIFLRFHDRLLDR